MTPRPTKAGVAGRLADFFIDSKLTPLLLAAALGVGLWSVFSLPSREEPEIVVPVADIFLPMPGVSPEEVENRALVPLEEVLGGIEDVEYVYAHAEEGFGLVTVRYEVGTDMEAALVRLHSRLLGNADRMPTRLSGGPLVRTVTIDDVPFLTLALSGEGYGHDELRRIAEELAVELRVLDGIREVRVTGGSPREITVALESDRMTAYGVDPPMVVERLAAANSAVEAGEYVRGSTVVSVGAGPFLASAADVRGVVLDVRDGQLVQVGDVAEVHDGPGEVEDYTFLDRGGAESRPLVTLAVAKRPGVDESELGEAIVHRVEELQGRLVPADVAAEVTRNYGESAREKVNTLRLHLLLAILAVGLVVALGMGWRAALVVMTAVPVTFALTLLTYHLFDYTLNRVTLFALIFVTGIVIDDSIIVVENMHRHFVARDRPLRQAAREAVDEVGNPTILATLTVIAAVLPMLFVSGLMGPYMSPMPIGSTLAMTFSLLVALIGAPWLAFRLLVVGRGPEEPSTEAGEGGRHRLEETRPYRLYERVMAPLLDRPRRMHLLLGGVGVLLLGAGAMFAARGVVVKMLPFDDKDEIQVLLDMPEGTALETTAGLAGRLSAALTRVPEVADVQQYVGTAAPFNFNGMIRHYYLRSGPTVADLTVDLVGKGDRSAQSHDVASRLRPIVDSLAAASKTGVRTKVVEIPPGPPVLSTLVAEVYGRDRDAQVEAARRVRELFEATPGVVDVDWSLRDPQRRVAFRVDPERAGLSGVDRGRVVGALRAGLAGAVATSLSIPESRVPVPVRVRLTEGSRSGSERLADLHVLSRSGAMVPVREVTDRVEERVSQVIDRKNGQRVVYVTADVAGEIESPVYAILDLGDGIDTLSLASGTGLPQLFTRPPVSSERPVMTWDGEWRITYEVFRDLGIAFAGALLLIYLLVVAWFGSFTTPLIMMAAIPLTLIGIAPGHWAFGAFFTATSMIGMIALAGIMVRNGILLVDYLEARLRAGVPIREAVIQAGAVRTRPILLTAGTVVIGAFVILFDPIFQGLAVSLITGAVASTALTLVVVPGLYFLAYRRGERIASEAGAVR